MKGKGIVLALVTLAVCANGRLWGQGTILWNEAVNGPLSLDSDNPTILPVMQFGTNSLIGAAAVERAGQVWYGYDDFFQIRIPAGTFVSSAFVTVDRPNAGIWLGDTGYSNHIAFVANPLTESLLSQWGLPYIAPGAYGMYVGNNDLQLPSTVLNYRLDFVVVPEPCTLALVLAGAVGLHGFRRLRCR